jgi:hypothetical protein
MDKILALDREFRSLLMVKTLSINNNFDESVLKSPTSIVESNSIVFSPRPDGDEKVPTRRYISDFNEFHFPIITPEANRPHTSRRSAVDLLEIHNLPTRFCKNKVLAPPVDVSIQKNESILSSPDNKKHCKTSQEQDFNRFFNLDEAPKT